MPRRPTPLTRRIILIAAVAIVGVLLATRGREAWREMRYRLQMRELQRICMQHTRPIDEVVYDDDPAVQGTRDPAVTHLRFVDQPNGRHHIARLFKPLDTLLNRDHYYSPQLFLHARRVGHRQSLVIVDLGIRFGSTASPTFTIDAVSMAPITPFGYPPLIGSHAILSFPKHSNEASVRFFAGQPDPDDSTRFTMPFEVAHEAGVIEGRVNDDGHIKLSILAGPGSIIHRRTDASR